VTVVSVCRRLGAGGLICLLLAAQAAAHPASETRVVITLAPLAFDVALIGDAEALVARLDAQSGAPLPPAAADRRAAAARLATLGAVLSDHVNVAFDGQRVAAGVSSIEVDDRGLATVHLTGAVPPASIAVTFATDLMSGVYPLVVNRRGDDPVVRWIEGHVRSEPVAVEGSGRIALDGSVTRGVWLGFTHIIPKGLDHILFVVGLVLLSQRIGQLLWQISAFTVAHSLTLGLGLYEVVSVPAVVVEPLIALSVAYVGVENLFTTRLQPWRVIIVFGFGLLHGLGFAEAFGSLALSPADFLRALVSFNAGVELGQLTVIALTSLAIHVALRGHAAWQRPVTRLASAAVGLAGLLWTVERVV
jgi:hypothetical protein